MNTTCSTTIDRIFATLCVTDVKNIQFYSKDLDITLGDYVSLKIDQLAYPYELCKRSKSDQVTV
jgi:hypothetical protein